MGIMSISGTSGSSSTNSTASTTTDRSLELGQDAFMKLLLTQLKYQDPLNPMEDKDFMVQLAQFSSLTEIQKMNESISLSNATDLIGKTVTGIVDSKESTEITGVVKSVTLKNSKVYVNIDDKDVLYSSIKHIGGSSDA